tara:strand:+ start:1296 stop:1688 length:393 start_codon:yes stop_codon:yes gene_type:complete
MNKRVTSLELQKFGLLIGISIPLLFGFLIPFSSHKSFTIWPFLFGILFLIVGIKKPTLLKIPYLIWMSLGNKLGRINNIILIGIIFIFIMQPTALLMKIFGYDPLMIKRKKTKSYLIKEKRDFIDLRRIF